jgi:hypothetical protein
MSSYENFIQQEKPMRRKVFKITLPLLAILALSLLLTALLWGKQEAPTAQASPLLRTAYQQADNSQCLACHASTEDVYTFPDGSTISLQVHPDVYGEGVHSNLACQVCHTDITGYPHPENTAQSSREYTLQYKDTCNQCHPGQAEKVHDSAHARLAEAGNTNTPVCADCHNPHTQKAIQKDANGDPAASENQVIAETCSKCHSAIVDKYKNSVHGKAVFGENNPDVPACHDCHGIHNIATARSEEFRLNSPQLCAECHTRGDIMDKYGISTDVLDTYISDFHGTTVAMFEHEDPSIPTNKPVCYDCHGVHDITSTSDPEKGLQVKQNMLVTCQKCHPDATENFPTAWMSHYIASPTNFPLVFYVQWFYRLFIPAVLGGMALFVASDVLRRFYFDRRKKSTSPAEPKE